MENMLGNLRWQICSVILMILSYIARVFQRTSKDSKLFLDVSVNLIRILGYITSKHGIKPAEHNIKAVRNFPRLTKVKEVQSFLGMCSYYRKSIKNVLKIADSLTNLILKMHHLPGQKGKRKPHLSPPILGHFNPNAPTYIHTDASNIGIGATLVQDIGGEEKVISYLSRTLSKAEQNYSTTEKECLAVVWSMSKLRPYLYGRHFKIVTDHHALCWLKNLKDTTEKKWIIVLTDYYTRYAETRAVSEATVEEVSKFLVEDIFLRHGAP
ncbi:K02A2.6-like [Cordylochernes scorpioides]|uniref:K02A2.6-like n=1 Tax=Cordylochernes scorpioides TaxID=51811 RepID=A0ABY6L2Z2_9ARAC|nr:K02A2.6-like [Cordylochernes scorpioides]